jgi:hypothetical protein
MVHLSSVWRDEIREAIEQHKEHAIGFKETTGIPQAKKFIILTLVNKGVPFKVLDQGCGVTTITTETDVCPKCNGTGRI